MFSKLLEQLGKHPDNLKITQISAIHTGKGSKSNSDNYMYSPISVLSVVARLFEKLIHQHLFPYLRDLLSDSTETSLLNMTDEWIINLTVIRLFEDAHFLGLTFETSKKI